MVAAMTLRFLDPFGTGKLVLFQVTYDKVCKSPFSATHTLLTSPITRIGTLWN
jgi:hypothetical protein